jgi:chemotaxis regulatin CheY-phosphate phosphatase CheZ
MPPASSDAKHHNGELLDELKREIREQVRDVFLSELSAFRREVSLNNDKLMKIIESQSSLINGKLKVIDAIKKENDELRSRVSLLETRCDPLVLADEIEERISRSINIIMCNLRRALVSPTTKEKWPHFSMGLTQQ